MRVRALLLSLLIVVSNPGYAGLFGDKEARRQIADQQALIGDLFTRIARLEEVLDNQALLNFHTQIEALKQDINKLRGQIEVLVNENELTQKRQRDFYIDLDSRLRRIEQPAPPAMSASPVPSEVAGSESDAPLPVTVVDTPAANAATAEAAENGAYEAAYDLFKAGSYQDAISRFQNLLESHPRSRFAPSAHYWIGNAYYALRDFDNAIETQRNLIKAFPDSAKAPDALLNIASSQREMNKIAASRKTLEELIARYPISDAADKAKQRLVNRK
ncbi:MAG: tol-pal system protein YbgF [Nitrosomonadaceae bacterium]|nr:tol-pal system protein YbgF [Nitrosomonadaceae bacterium]